MQSFKTLFGRKPGDSPHRPLPAPQERLTGPRLSMRLATPLDWSSWHEIRAENRAYLQPWEPLWPKDSLTYDYFCRNVRRQWREWRDGQAYAFLIFMNDAPAEVVGGLSLNDVHRGIGQKGTIGYWLGEKHANQGFMTEAATLALDFAFHRLGLHRLEATSMPANAASRHLLEKLGFDEEGYARAYLRINGQWEDHILWGKVNDAPP